MGGVGVLALREQVRAVAQGRHIDGIHGKLVLAHDVDRQVGQVGIFQRYIADVPGVGVSLAIMPGLHHDTLGKDILLLKEHIQRHLYLVQRPLSLMIGGEDRNEHIGVMPDLVQVEVVFVVGMGTLVGVQVVLQLRLHPSIGGLRAQHGLVGRGIGGAGDARHAALHQHGTGGHAVEEERDYQKQARSNQKALFVPPRKVCRLTALFRRLLCRLGRVRGSLPNGGGGLTGAAGGGILPLDGLLLLPTRQRITRKAGVLFQALLI